MKSIFLREDFIKHCVGKDGFLINFDEGERERMAKRLYNFLRKKNKSIDFQTCLEVTDKTYGFKEFSVEEVMGELKKAAEFAKGCVENDKSKLV